MQAPRDNILLSYNPFTLQQSMKKVLVGLCDNINHNFQKINVWKKSFSKYCNDDVVLLCANSTKEENNLCESIGIKCINVIVEDRNFINHKRLYHLCNFFNESSYDLILSTDVFDVAFQGDPFQKLDINSYDIFISGEGVNVNQEPWNSDNIKKLFENKLEFCMNNEVLCSGIIAGKKIPMINLYKKLYEMCEQSSNDHNIKDQAALICLAYTTGIENLKILNLDDGWAMHCAVAGPTPFFTGWGFKDNIKYGIPKLYNNYICTKSNEKYDIVHQFNRVPEWHKIIIENI